MANPLAPLTPPYPPAIEEKLQRYPGADRYLLTLFRTFANSERFLAKGVPNLLDEESPLPMRTREIAILRITGLFGCAYEWGVHVTAFGPKARISEEEARELFHQRSPSGNWTDAERRLIAAIDALCLKGDVMDDERAAFQSDWTAEQQLEIAALVGAYHTVSCVANIARLAPEPFAARP